MLFCQAIDYSVHCGKAYAVAQAFTAEEQMGVVEGFKVKSNRQISLVNIFYVICLHKVFSCLIKKKTKQMATFEVEVKNIKDQLSRGR